MTGPISEHGTPVKKSNPAPSRRSTNGPAGKGALTAGAGGCGRGRSPLHLGPGAAVVLEAVDLHPALVDVDPGHRVPPVDQRLQDLCNARPLQPFGTLRQK